MVDAKGSKAGALNEAERERVIREFTPVIKAMAHRLAFRLPAHLDAEDLVSVGVIGLMDAMNKYDPTREAKFKTYAEFRIRGAMLDEIRSMDWIPRSVHERIALLQRTQTELMRKYGRPPTDEEVAAALKMSLEELDDFLARSQGAVLLSIQDLGAQELDGHVILRVLIDEQNPDPLSAAVSENVREILGKAIQELPEKERLVLTLYYYEELTMKEIGSILKVTESRVCQIHAKAILRLKAKLKSIL
ncbi:MAG: FliA/WhiG family RNA polymerase sigma factor [Nitrospirota bacterium]